MSTDSPYLRPEPEPVSVAIPRPTGHSAMGADIHTRSNPNDNLRTPIDYMLNDNEELEPEEKLEMERVLQCITEANLRNLEKLVQSYSPNPARLAKLVNAIKRIVESPQISIPYTPVARSQLSLDDKVHDIVILTIRLKNPTGFRTISIATDPRYKTRVCGPPKDALSVLPIVLPEDPKVLFTQIGRLVALPMRSSPPPLTMAYN